MSYKEEIAVIIPAYNPDQKLLTLLKQLAEAGFQNIVIIDDGSREENRHIFTQAAEICDCRILKHHVNLGKGRALKDGFNHVNELPHCAGAITLDADGQHSVEDAVKCAEETLNHPTALIMGCRNFLTKRAVPQPLWEYTDQKGYRNTLRYPRIRHTDRIARFFARADETIPHRQRRAF